MNTSLLAKAAFTSLVVAMSAPLSGCGTLHADSTSILNAAAVSQPSKNQAGYYRMQVGAVEVIALSDGTVPIDTGLLNGDPKSISASLAQAYQQSPVDTSVNAYLIRTGTKLIMVDTGTSELFGPGVGKIPHTLRALGYQPEQITDILITHIHTDHTGGLMIGSSRVFPNAVVHMERKELAFWLDPANKASAVDGQKAFFDQAVLKVTPYVNSGQIVTFDGATQLFPGITSIPAPGHTPGHTIYELTSQGQKLLFWGDIIHVEAAQLPDPNVTIQFDVSPAQASALRVAQFAEVSAKGTMVAPAHVAFPGFGRMRRNPTGAGYVYYPVLYKNDANLDTLK